MSPTVCAALATHSVLVIDPALDDMLPMVLALSREGLHVTVAATFAQAKQLLIATPPSVLLASVRLGLYNGLHLVVHGKAINPGLAALVVSPVPDPSLQLDAEALGATFMVKPLTEREVFAAMLQTLFRRTEGPIRPPFERRSVERRTVVRPFMPEQRTKDRRFPYR